MSIVKIRKDSEWVPALSQLPASIAVGAHNVDSSAHPLLVKEAPQNNKLYGRRNGLWSEVSGGGSSVYINVLDYGVDPTGEEDISEIVNALEVERIYFPAGTYLIDYGIILDNKKIMVDSDAEFICGEHISGYTIRLDNSIWSGGQFVSERIQSVFGLYSGNCKLENAQITHSAGLTNTYTTVSVRCKIAEIKSCVIDGQSNTKMGIWCDGQPNQTVSLTVSQCEIHHYYLNAIFTSAITGTYIDNYFHHNHIQTNPNGGGQIDVTQKADEAMHIVMGNLFENPGGAVTSGIEAEGGRCFIIGNKIGNTGGFYGIAVQDAYAEIMSNRVTTDNGACIYFNASAYGNTENNELIASSSAVTYKVLNSYFNGRLSDYVEDATFDFGTARPFFVNNLHKNPFEYSIPAGEHKYVYFDQASFVYTVENKTGNSICMYYYDGSKHLLISGTEGSVIVNKTVAGYIDVKNSGSSQIDISLTRLL